MLTAHAIDLPRYILSQGGFHRSGSGLVHARAVSFAWGFADDVVVRVRCGASGSMAVLEAQVIFPYQRAAARSSCMSTVHAATASLCCHSPVA